MREKPVNFMRGRYGFDDLCGFMTAAAGILLIINIFAGLWVLTILAVAIIVLCYYRAMSRKIEKRYTENQVYVRIRGRVFGFFRSVKAYLRDSRTYLMFRCPDCGQKLRVPRGKGRIVVTCPKCKKSIRKKS